MRSDMKKILKKQNGITLIELLVALVITAGLIATIYRTFIGQQKTYVVQEQVVDMQQNMRIAINRMMTEIRMAGFGNLSMVLPVTIGGKTFNNAVNVNTPTAGALTIVSGTGGTATLTNPGTVGQNQVVVSTLTDAQGNLLFDTGNRRYVCVGGLESYTISSIDAGTRTITLNGTLLFNHLVGTSVFTIKALSYQVTDVDGTRTLLRDENLGAGPQPQADHIENLQFATFDGNGNPTVNPPDIRVIRTSLIARTAMPDPELKGTDGYRRREIASNIHLRNMGMTP